MRSLSIRFKNRGVVLISMLGILLLLSILGGYYAWKINGALRLHNLIEVDKVGAIAFTDRLRERGVQFEKIIKTCRNALCDLEGKIQGDIKVGWREKAYANRFDQTFPSQIKKQMMESGQQYLVINYYDAPMEFSYFELWGLDDIERRFAYLSIEMIEGSDDRVLHGGRYYQLSDEDSSIVVESEGGKYRVELPSELFLNDGKEVLATTLSKHAYYLYLSDGNIWLIDLEELIESKRANLTWITRFSSDDVSGGDDSRFILQKIGSMLHLYKIDESFGVVQKSAFDLYGGRRYTEHKWIDIELSGDGVSENEEMFAWEIEFSERGEPVAIEKFAQHSLGITLKLEGQNRCLDIRADGRMEKTQANKSETEYCVLEFKRDLESRLQLHRLEG